jgi:uncharacterized protein (DUF2062 family)
MTWRERSRAIGRPLALGLAVFAVVGAAVTWVLVNVVWLFAAGLRLRRRRAQAPPRQ